MSQWISVHHSVSQASIGLSYKTTRFVSIGNGCLFIKSTYCYEWSGCYATQYTIKHTVIWFTSKLQRHIEIACKCKIKNGIEENRERSHKWWDVVWNIFDKHNYEWNAGDRFR